eukprot:g30632.t1
MLHSDDWGAEWLTKAMHAANTLPKDNRVTKVIPDKKITTGNNGGKFLFEVEYATPDEHLHTKLFAKIPHGMEKDGAACVFYFGDISNETSNWILITEAVNFHDPSPLDFAGKTVGQKKEQLKAYEIEGPYDKCMDWCLRGDPAEYYLALIRTGARMAGLFKSGAMGDPDVVAKHFENMLGAPKEAFGVQPGCSGQPPKMLKTGRRVDMGIELWSSVGAVLFPSFTKDTAWQTKFTATMMKLNAYAGESQYFMHHNDDYVSLAHGNMNVDNAYFWRNDSGALELGVFDWGFKLWWWLYCADFEVLDGHFDQFLDCHVESYQSAGGPKIDKEVLRMQFILASMTQMFGLVAAVSQIYRMCPKKDFGSIKDRYDSRVGENINGKSTLRLYLQVMRTILLIMENWKERPLGQLADKVLDDFEEKICGLLSMSKKDASTMEAA